MSVCLTMRLPANLVHLPTVVFSRRRPGACYTNEEPGVGEPDSAQRFLYFHNHPSFFCSKNAVGFGSVVYFPAFINLRKN